jgi:crossover junction endodeoxyribonuclease RuvC
MARTALGVDPGTALMGYAVVSQEGQQLELLACEALVTSSEQPMASRLKYLYDSLVRVIDVYQPTELAVEELFFNRNVQSALAVGQARGIAMLAGANRGLPVYSYTPLQVKSAISGYGRAQKQQIQEMVRILLQLSAAPQPDDAADAAAIAVCHLNTTSNMTLIDQLTIQTPPKRSRRIAG